MEAEPVAGVPRVVHRRITAVRRATSRTGCAHTPPASARWGIRWNIVGLATVRNERPLLERRRAVKRPRRRKNARPVQTRTTTPSEGAQVFRP